MVDRFLEALREKLHLFEMSEDERQDILSDYEQMIRDGLDKGKSEEEVLDMLGTPDCIVDSLSQEYKMKKRLPASEKIVALSPFVCTILYIIMGIAGGLWHPGWLIFLLIPVTAIVSDSISEGEKHLLTAISPFLAVIFFFFLGFFQGLWHPGWLVFFIVPVFAIFNSKKSLSLLALLTSLSPFFTLTAFFIVGHITGVYHPTWVVLLLVLFLGILHEKKAAERYILAGTLAFSTALYLVLGYAFEDWLLALGAYLIFAVALLATGNRIIQIDGFDTPLEKSVGVVSLLLFALIGYFFSLFAISWLFLLLIPITSILLNARESKKFTAISPFVSVAAFMLIGYFGGYWHPGWLVFLLIPIVAIIEDA